MSRFMNGSGWGDESCITCCGGCICPSPASCYCTKVKCSMESTGMQGILFKRTSAEPAPSICEKVAMQFWGARYSHGNGLQGLLRALRSLPRSSGGLWCCGPGPLPRGHLCSNQLLGFLRALRASHCLPQLSVLDLLVPGKPHCAI